jgi:hypothetical protein
VKHKKKKLYVYDLLQIRLAGHEERTVHLKTGRSISIPEINEKNTYYPQRRSLPVVQLQKEKKKKQGCVYLKK